MTHSSIPDDRLQIDIVSDVMCPWCIVGFKQLEQALDGTGVQGSLRWHPFELNPAMPETGQDLAEHLGEKYGTTPAQSVEARARLEALGTDLGFAFNFSETSRIVNTFLAHQLLDWAEGHGKQHALQMALFSAHFTEARDVSDTDVLIDIAGTVGLDRSDAANVLTSGVQAEAVREKQAFWTMRGISGVPSVIFGGKYLLTGAQGVQTYTDVLRKVQGERKAA